MTQLIRINPTGPGRHVTVSRRICSSLEGALRSLSRARGGPLEVVTLIHRGRAHSTRIGGLNE